MTRAILALAAIALLAIPAPPAAALSTMEQIEVETFAKLREVERYQLKIAEKHYEKGEFAIALAEYEKYLTLYENSAAAPYAQLMWSHCQVRLKKLNTAIRDGFQSVIDYWPSSAEAVLASYLIASTYQSMGEVEKAEPAYLRVIRDHPDHDVAVRSKVALLDLAKQRGDSSRAIALLRDLTFTLKRTEATAEVGKNASRELAARLIGQGDLAGAEEALATTYQDDALTLELQGLANDAIRRQCEDEKTREDGRKLADLMIARLERLIPVDLQAEGARDRAKDILYRIAGVHGNARRGGEVYQVYERAAKLLGEDDEILGQMADWHKGNDGRDKAKAIYARFQNQIAGQGAIAAMLREEGKFDAAIEIYRALIDLNPDGTDEYLWAIAECYESSGRLKLAIQTFRQVDRFPDNYFRMASCHRRLMEYNEALVLYNQCKVHDGAAPNAFIQIAYTYEEAGQREKAIKAFQLTCKSHPKSGQASEAHSHLQSKYNISVTLGGAKEE